MSTVTLIPFQLPLPQLLPTVHGNVDYNLFRKQLLRIDQLLVCSNLETQLLQADLQAWMAKGRRPSAKQQQRRQLHCRRALRCNIARLLVQEDFRGFAARLADSSLLQYFCGLSTVEGVCVPSKSTLQRYSVWWKQGEVRRVLYQLLAQGADAPQGLELAEPLDLESAFMDTTCVGVNIHYPVDWVLLRDATRTLVRAIELIRAHGLKHRMEEPRQFLTRINTLCIEMTHAWNQTDSRRKRKRILRQMDRLVGMVRAHAQRHRDRLDTHWDRTNWSRAQAQQVLARIDQVLEQLPKARRQARQRILEGKAPDNEQKILSLYEPEVQVIVRQKAGAYVEFGNSLFLAENAQGLIIDWELFRDRAPADTDLLPRSIGRMEAAYGSRLKRVAADRGFDSQANQIGLADEGIYNGVCPRSPAQLQQRARCWKFKRLQRRRAQTEARVGILKNVFLNQPLRCKGFEHRALTVSWTVLVHNLWVMARMPRHQTQTAERAAA